MDEGDRAVRNLTLFVDLGRAPTVADVAAAAGSTTAEVGASWHRLHDAHALVLQPDTTELRMANPFSAVATPYRVGRIETTCAECADSIVCEVVDQRPDDGELLFHCLVPAARWWDDIVFT